MTMLRIADASHFGPLIILEAYSEMLICVTKSEIWAQIATVII
jgi:hypothetical protein